MFHLRISYVKRVFLCTLLVLLFLLLVLLFKSNEVLDQLDRTKSLMSIDKLIKNFASYKACKQPNLPVNAPELMKFIKEVPPINCKLAGRDWVTCKDSECRVSEEIKAQHGQVKCAFTDLIRSDDFTVTNGETTNTDSFYKLESSDVVSVSCKSPYGKWSSVLTGIRQEPKIYDSTGWEYVANDALKLNVLMFGFDSMSRNSFIRKLPKTYQYLSDVLEAHVLQGYNIIGDGTPQALIPILTGQTELELPDTRKRLRNSNYVNVYPFVWKEFKRNGYVTAYYEDMPDVGIFTYRLKGFDEPPTDHYMRPYYLASSAEIRKWPQYCMGSKPRHMVMLNQIKNFFSVYKSKPKFLFGFHGELSHDDYNLVGAADADVYEFVKDLHESGALNNTVFIFMSDHGNRFADVRNTIQGKQEERLPFFSFRFPPWFKNKYPNAYSNFLSNKERLTTPFDIYPTLLDLLQTPNTEEASLENRSISLFKKIPESRSCMHAYIEPHWCACLEWDDIPMTHPIVERLGNTLVDTINEYTKGHREVCAPLTLATMLYVKKMQPNENLVKFRKTADYDGFIADLSGKMKLKTEMYQIKAKLVPGESLFEASISHYLDTDELKLKISDISRINQYGEQARCIMDELLDLRKYCYCVD